MVIRFAFHKPAMLQFENNLAEKPIVLKDGNKIWLARYKIAFFFFYDNVAFIEDCRKTSCARRVDIENSNFNNILCRARIQIRAFVTYQMAICLENVHIHAHTHEYSSAFKNKNKNLKIFLHLNMFGNFSIYERFCKIIHLVIYSKHIICIIYIRNLYFNI